MKFKFKLKCANKTTCVAEIYELIYTILSLVDNVQPCVKILYEIRVEHLRTTSRFFLPRESFSKCGWFPVSTLTLTIWEWFAYGLFHP